MLNSIFFSSKADDLLPPNGCKPLRILWCAIAGKTVLIPDFDVLTSVMPTLKP